MAQRPSSSAGSQVLPLGAVSGLLVWYYDSRSGADGMNSYPLMILLIALAGLLIRTNDADAGSTPYAVTFQINPAHTGHAEIANFKGKLKILWSIKLPGYAISYPLIANGMIFVTQANKVESGYGTKLYALDASTGAVVWKKSISGTYWWSNAAYDNDEVFVVNEDGAVEAFDAVSGAENWSVQIGQSATQVSSAPVAHNGHLFLNVYSSGGYLYALDEADGSVIWNSFDEMGDDSSPALGGNGLFVSYPCQYFGFNAQSGAEEWFDNENCDGGGGFAPVYFEGRVYVRDPLLGCYILDAKTGAVDGTFDSETPPSFFNYDKKAYGVELTNTTMSGFDVASGSVLWTFTGDGYLSSSPITVNKYAIVGSARGNLYVVDGVTGKLVWSGHVGHGIQYPNEDYNFFPLTGLATAGGIVVVPAGRKLVALAPE